MKKHFTVNLISYFIFVTLATSLISFIILQNLSPLGATLYYSLTDTKKNISEPGPKDRVKKETIKGQNIYKQRNDFIYFSTQMPFQFDSAKIKITYLNPYLDQEIYLGFRDRKEWHYDNKLISSPLLDSLSWSRTGEKPVLYQKEKKYNTAFDFLKNPPTDKIIGTYDYDKEAFNISRIKLPNYQKAITETVIDSPLRGKHILYAYLRDEAFRITVQKQDLNWYKDPDPITINVYKDVDKVYSATIDDDGIVDDSKKTSPPQNITIKNPGPGLPENGVYKIVIDSSYDSIITKISSNLHKIVFGGPIFLAGNSQVYKPVIKKTIPTYLFTNALSVGTLAYHSIASQNINIGGQKLSLTANQPEEIISQGTTTSIMVSENDVVLKGNLGYFAFDENQFFKPTPYNVLPITKMSDFDIADYIVSDYSPAKKESGLQVSEKEFDLSSAYTKNNALNWIIKSPNLNDNNREIQIYNIEVTFYKKPLDIKNLWK